MTGAIPSPQRHNTPRDRNPIFHHSHTTISSNVPVLSPSYLPFHSRTTFLLARKRSRRSRFTFVLLLNELSHLSRQTINLGGLRVQRFLRFRKILGRGAHLPLEGGCASGKARNITFRLVFCGAKNLEVRGHALDAGLQRVHLGTGYSHHMGRGVRCATQREERRNLDDLMRAQRK